MINFIFKKYIHFIILYEYVTKAQSLFKYFSCTTKKWIWLIEKILFIFIVLWTTLLPFATSLPCPYTNINLQNTNSQNTNSQNTNLQGTIEDLEEQIKEFNKDIGKLNQAINDATNDFDEKIQQTKILKNIYEKDGKLLEQIKYNILNVSHITKFYIL